MNWGILLLYFTFSLHLFISPPVLCRLFKIFSITLKVKNFIRFIIWILQLKASFILPLSVVYMKIGDAKGSRSMVEKGFHFNCIHRCMEHQTFVISLRSQFLFCLEEGWGPRMFVFCKQNVPFPYATFCYRSCCRFLCSCWCYYADVSLCNISLSLEVGSLFIFEYMLDMR